MNDDGRLDLDDLGSVIERASSIDEPADVVGEEPRRTWGERLEASGVSPWVRRHRVALAAGTAAVVVVGVGATAWVRAQPPPWHDPVVQAVSATLDSDFGTALRSPGDGTAVAAYLVTTDDAGLTLTIDGVEGPGIRATTAGPPLTTGNPKGQVVRAAFGCDDGVLTATPGDYRLRITAVDAWGRSTTVFTGVPSDGNGWREAVMQNCWRQAVLTRVAVGGIEADVDEGAAAVRLRITLTSTLPGDVRATVDGYIADTGIVPTGAGTELPPGVPTTVDGRVDVWDCSAGTPGLPQVSFPVDAAVPNAYRSADGVGVQVFSQDRQAWDVIPAVFTPSQAESVRRALAQVCAGAPAVGVGSTQVVRTVIDDGAGNASLTLVLDVDLPPGRLAQVGVQQDYAIASPDPSTQIWSIVPRGGGRAEAVWTFSCYATPVPPALDVRFIDGIRPTPVRVPLDQETLAPWLSDACPDMTPDRLVESGWQLP